MSAARRRIEAEPSYTPTAAKPSEATPVFPETASASMPLPEISRKTLEEYQEIERGSPVRHEYLDGEIRAMAGTVPEHNVIAGNLYRSLGNRFEDKNCTAYFADIKVTVSATRYRYPDVIALCGDSLFDNQRPPALLNPMVIIEVLSPSTEDLDRTEKFLEYRSIASLTDYVLISQEQMLVIHFARKSPTSWAIDEYSQPEQTLSLPALDVAVPLAEIYRKVSFPSAAE